MTGSTHNDPFYNEAGRIRTRTNNSGGIQGGISNGESIVIRAAFKPVATIMMPQETVDEDGNPTELSGRGRHDPCVLPRAVPMVEGDDGPRARRPRPPAARSGRRRGMTERKWDASRYDSAHSFVWERGRGVVELLAPARGERILDLGCGTGHLTSLIAESGAEVVGIDSSEDMVRVASKNYPNIRFEVADARSLLFDGEFDAVFSNAVLHWGPPPGGCRRVGLACSEAGRKVRRRVRRREQHQDHHDRRRTGPRHAGAETAPKSTGPKNTFRHSTSTLLSWKAATSASCTQITSRGRHPLTAAKKD